MSGHRSRRNAAAIATLVCLAVLASVVFFAVNADGREGTESTTNDGGAWLVNRRAGVIGHVNRSVQEISAAVKVSQAGGQFDVLQPQGVIVAHDLTSGSIEVVDERTHLVVNSMSLPAGAQVREFATGIVVVAEAPFRVWRLDAAELAELQILDTRTPLYESPGVTAWQVSFDGDVAVDDRELGQLAVFRISGTIDRWDRSQTVTEIAFDGDRPVAMIGDRFARIDGDRLESVGDQLDTWDVAQVSAPERVGEVVGITPGGVVQSIDTSTGLIAVVGQLVGSGFAAPIVHNGCTHAVVNQPATYWVRCGQGEARSTLLNASPQSRLRLRLVDGSIWVNDLEANSLWMVNDELELSRIDDWGVVLPQDASSEEAELSAAQTADDIVEDVENPDAEDAETIDADQFDEDGINQPPVAFDDEDVQTHLGRPVVIDVVANDEDPDNDVLLVASVENLSGADAIVRPTVDGTSIQVSPAADFEGVIRYTYTISDGRGGTDSASGSVTVRARTGVDNQPPVAVTDLGSIAIGESLILNVLSNDFDPDGDSLVLTSANAPEGTVTFDASGQIIFEPESIGQEGEIELSYTIVDDFGELAEGRIRVDIRLRDSNQPPDARNDGGVTVVGQPVKLDLLLNDSDPDGDDLFVAQRPELLSPPNTEVFTTITADGEFVFIPEAAGTYLFSYGASDQEETDLAQIRIEVGEGGANQPPLAVRDDAVIPAGESRIVYSLMNDGDPDGDVIGIVDFNVTPGSGLVVERFGDNAFRVLVEEAGEPRRTFRYSISDGESEPVETVVVIAVADPGSVNQPPIAQADVVEIRPGTTTSVDVLRNDFDPEGGPLRVVGASAPDDATAQIGADNQFVRIGANVGTTAGFTVTYEVADEQGNRTAAVVRVQIVADGQPNRPPIARPDSARTLFEVPLTVSAIANDTDPDGDAIRVESITRQPANGRAEFDEATGEIIYTPAPRFSGTDRFSYSIVDAFGARSVGEVLVGVLPEPSPNRDPIGFDDLFIVIANGTTTDLTVLINDSDPDGDQLRISDVTTPELGTVERSLDGRALTFTAPIEQADDREARFIYTISDGNGGSATAEVTVVVQATPPQAPGVPVAVNDDAGTHATGAAVRVAVVVNDLDPDTPIDDLVVSVFDPELSIEGQTLVFIAPEADTEYSYQITDPQGNQDTATVTVTIVNPKPPVAVDDSWGPTAQGDTIEIPVLVNDFDPDGVPEELEIVSVTGADAQVVDRAIRITAPAESAQYTYTIVDADGLEATASISLIVADNRAPIVEAQTVTTGFEEPVRIDLSTAGTDPDGDALFYSCCQTASNGSPVVLDAGEGLLLVEFTPDDGFDGNAVFSYEVDDQFGNVVAGSVTVEVLEQPNRPPTATDAALSIQVPRPGGPVITESLDLAPLTEDPDLDDDLTWSVEQQPGQDLTAALAGSVLEISATDGSDPGSTAMAWRVTDAEGESVTATVTIDVAEPTNEPPQTSDITVTVAAGATESVDLEASTSDADPGELLTFAVSGDPGSGVSATLTGGSTVTVAAPVNASGASETITYLATDRLGEESSSSLTIEVGSPTEDPPTAVADQADTLQGVPVVIPVLDNDTDPLGLELTIVDPGSTTDGTVTVVGTALSFAPSAGFFGQAQFTYTIRDAADVEDREATATVTVDVTGRPDAPAAPTCTAGSTLVNLTWTTPNGNGDPAGQYQVEHDVGGGPLDVGDATSYEWTDLTNDTDYRFRITASNVAGASLPSAWSLVCTPDIEPEQPAPPTVVHGDGLLTVSWEKPTNRGSRILNYELRIGGGNAVPITGLTHEWKSLVNGRDYTFEVAAVNDAGRSTFSAPSVPEHPSTTPGIPVIGTTTRGGLIGASASNFLEMHWTSVPVSNDGGDDIDFYEVDRRPGSIPPIQVLGANANSYLWSGLRNGTPHEFRVRAHNRDGVGDWSAWSGALEPCTVPGLPSIDNLTPRDGVVDVTFSAPADNGGCKVTSFNVRVAGSPDLGTSASEPGTVPKPELDNGESYAFEVRASNVVGSSDWVTSDAVVPLGGPMCGAGFQVDEITRTSQTLTWDDADFNGGTSNGYEHRANGGAWQANGTAASAVLSLTPNQSHTVDLRAINEIGSDFCGTVTFTSCPTAPPQVAKPSIDAQADGWIIITFTWPTIPCLEGSQPVVGDFSISRHETEADQGRGGSGVGQGASPTKTSALWPNYGGANPVWAPGDSTRGRVRACFAAADCGPWSPWSDVATVPNSQTISISLGDSFPAPCSAFNDPWSSQGPCYGMNWVTSGFSPTYYTKCFSADANGIWDEWGTAASYLTTTTVESNVCVYGGPGGAVILLARNTEFEPGIFAGQPVANFTVPDGYVASNVLTWPTD